SGSAASWSRRRSRKSRRKSSRPDGHEPFAEREPRHQDEVEQHAQDHRFCLLRADLKSNSRAPPAQARQVRGSRRAGGAHRDDRREILCRLRAPPEASSARGTLGAMFDIGLQEMLVIGLPALLVFGPSKLPELGRMVGRALREFRRASDEFRSTVETNLHINEPDPPPVSSYASTPSEAAPTLPSETEPIAPETSDLPAAVGTDIAEHGE